MAETSRMSKRKMIDYMDVPVGTASRPFRPVLRLRTDGCDHMTVRLFNCMDCGGSLDAAPLTVGGSASCRVCGAAWRFVVRK
jgi:hypothetical protein